VVGNEREHLRAGTSSRLDTCRRVVRGLGVRKPDKERIYVSGYTFVIVICSAKGCCPCSAKRVQNPLRIGLANDQFFNDFQRIGRG
jgi:hypothetical protein